jgi:predicted transcriptional regulator with HTH domain
MLEHLFGSKTRVKLLSLFLRHPDEAIFVRELTRRVGTQINAVRRELANLVRFGLIREVVEEGVSEEGVKRPGLKRKYYKVNKSFSLLPEITSLIVKAQVMLEQQLDQHLLKIGDVRYMAFLGLFLGKAGAPVDIFMVAEKVDKKAMDKILAQTEQDLGVEIRYSLMTLDEFRYRKDITDRFLYAILEAPKNVVVDKLAERIK